MDVTESAGERATPAHAIDWIRSIHDPLHSLTLSRLYKKKMSYKNTSTLHSMKGIVNFWGGKKCSCISERVSRFPSPPLSLSLLRRLSRGSFVSGQEINTTREIHSIGGVGVGGVNSWWPYCRAYHSKKSANKVRGGRSVRGCARVWRLPQGGQHPPGGRRSPR